MNQNPQFAPAGGNDLSGWRTVNTALLLTILAIFLCIFAGFMIAMSMMSAMTTGMAAGASGANPQAAAQGMMGMMQQALVYMLLVFVGGILYIVGNGMCMAVPKSSGLKTVAVTAFVLLMAYIGIGVMAQMTAQNQMAAAMQNNASPFGDMDIDSSTGQARLASSPVMRTMGAMMLAAMFCSLGSWIAFMLFLRGTGKYFNANGTATLAGVTMILGAGSILAMIAAGAGMMPQLAQLGGLGILVSFIMFIVTLFAARGAIKGGLSQMGTGFAHAQM